MTPSERIEYIIRTAMKNAGFDDDRKCLDHLDVNLVIQEVKKVLTKEKFYVTDIYELQQFLKRK